MEETPDESHHFFYGNSSHLYSSIIKRYVATLTAQTQVQLVAVNEEKNANKLYWL